MDIRVECFEQVDSTNVVVKEQIKQGQPEGYVCRALRQTGGYGRQGRTWVSFEGGSYQSILLRPELPQSEWPTLTLVVGLAIRRALLDLCQVPAAEIFVKWPNDVMTPAGKLVGISCEAQGSGICVGVGVNVLRPAETVQLPGKNTPAYVTDLLAQSMSADARSSCVVDSDKADGSQAQLIEAVSERVLQSIDRYYETWNQKGFSPFLEEYREANGALGRFVELLLVDGGMLAYGQIVDIDENGQLVIEECDGTVRSFPSGEVHIL